jgi:hypothetical protein
MTGKLAIWMQLSPHRNGIFCNKFNDSNWPPLMMTGSAPRQAGLAWGMRQRFDPDG